MPGESEEDEDAIEAQAEVAPGTPAPGASPDFLATMAAIAAARERGDLDEVKRLKAEFAASRAQE